MTKEEITICKMYLDDLDKTHDCNEYKLLMGLLEQQPSEDCVSRQAVVKFLKNHAEDFEDTRLRIGFFTSASLINNPDNVPPVTPTHGTCKGL